MTRASRGRQDGGGLVALCFFVFTTTLLCTCVRPAHARSSEELTIDGVEHSSDTPSSASFAVFGYLPEYRQLRFDYEAFFKSGLTHLIFFSAEVDPISLELTHVDDRLPSGKKWTTIRELADTYGVKLLLCIGGSGRSAGFASLVGDVLGRRRFINNVRYVVQSRQLDGIDFNWEYPSSMTEWLNFGQFLAELRSALGETTPINPHRGRRVRPALITMALHPHRSVPNLLRSSLVLPSIDYLHWMAYDHIAANESHSSVAYAASVLQDDIIGDFDDAVYSEKIARYRRGAHGGAATVEHAARNRTPHEIDHRRKLCLGIPFYGRHRSDMRVPPESYEHLWQFIRQWARKLHPDWVEGGPELHALSHYAGYDYNSYDDVKRKMRLARSSGIAGIMIWELGQDVPPGTSPMSLITAVHEQLTEWEKDPATSSGKGSGARVLSARFAHNEGNATSPSTEDGAEGDL